MDVALYIVLLTSPMFVILGVLILMKKLVNKKARLPFKIEDTDQGVRVLENLQI